MERMETQPILIQRLDVVGDERGAVTRPPLRATGRVTKVLFCVVEETWTQDWLANDASDC